MVHGTWKELNARFGQGYYSFLPDQKPTGADVAMPPLLRLTKPKKPTDFVVFIRKLTKL